MSYQTENTELLKSVLQGTFFNAWKTDKQDMANMNFKGLEMIIAPDCNLACKYCYLYKHKDGLYPRHLVNRETILNNASMLLDWFKKNDYRPKLDIFSGELFAQQVGFDILDLIYEKYRDVKGISFICVPTNFTFICSEETTARVEECIDRLESVGIRLVLSASIDGKYCEDNRPAKTGIVRDDAYYDKVFRFCKKHKFAFHPMIYSEHIDRWKDNFNWFIGMFEKHGFEGYPLYLLEVRNEEWTEGQMQGLYDFVQYLAGWVRDRRLDFHKNGFNILGSMINTIGRGIGCGIQASLYVRMGDLAIVPCHRTSYDGYHYGKFIAKNGAITDIEADNVENCITTYSFNADTLPMCETCAIKHHCSHGCMGCQLETVGDMFTPNPNVCKMEHYKVKAFMDFLDRRIL